MVYTIEEIKEKVKPIAEKYHLEKVYLFGSYARGEADEKSDVDIVIVPTNKTEFDWGVLGIQDSIEDVLNISVDCITFDNISNPRTPVGKMVLKNFLKDKVVLYEDS